MISDTNKTMLNIVSAAIHNQSVEGIEVLNWEPVYEELKAQSIHVLPSPYANQLGMTVDERKQYTIDIGNNLRQFYSVLGDQSNVITCLEKENIPSVILKGAAAAINYPHPEYRCMGDVDVLVQKEDFERAFHALCNAGYEPHQTLDFYYRHIGFTSESGIEVELHNHFSSSNNEEQNQVLDTMLFSAITCREIGELNGYTFPKLPVLENGLVLLTHINQHLGTGLGLRQIIDWMMYVEQVLNDDFWNEKFSQAADEIGLRKLAVVVTTMCAKYLELDEKVTWYRGYEEDAVCDDLMEYILSHGNFGRKDNSKDAVKVVRRWGSFADGFRYAQMSGKYIYPVFRKCSILSPFAWIAAIIRWIVLGLKKGIRPEKMKSISEKEKRETDLLERLGVTRR